MPLQFSDTLRNNRANQIETTLGTAPTMYIFSGPMPANCAAADAGTLLCQFTLPSDWLSNATTGIKTKVGTWTGTAGVAAGAGTAAGYFRLKTGSAVHMQGNITVTGGGGAMTIDNIMIVNGQPVNVTNFNVIDGNA
jgi:hypothetical protein